jgi:hypothetical protein
MGKKNIGLLTLIVAFLLIGFNVFAADGDLIVNGSVGVGTTTPAQKVDVSGQIHATGDICTDAAGGKCLGTVGSIVVATSFQSFYKIPFGDGSDGDVTISSNTTLPAGTDGVKVMKYNNLTVNSGVYLEGNTSDKALVILVKGTLTLNGTIRMNGRGGAGGAAGNGRGGGAGGFGGGAGGYTGDSSGGGGGGGGASGSNGLGYSGGKGGGQIPRGNPTDGFSYDPGGYIGAGGNSPDYPNNGPGGAGITIWPSPKNPMIFELARQCTGGGGGSGGGNGKAGGKGGGVIWVEANEIVWGGSGLTSANGNNGSGGGNGGGGGGGGGYIQIVYKTKAGTSSLQVNGGAGGTGGVAGGNGATGLTGEFQVQ